MALQQKLASKEIPELYSLLLPSSRTLVHKQGSNQNRYVSFRLSWTNLKVHILSGANYGPEIIRGLIFYGISVPG